MIKENVQPGIDNPPLKQSTLDQSVKTVQPNDIDIETERQVGERFQIYHWANDKAITYPIYAMELTTWPTWLQFSLEDIQHIAKNYPDTQFFTIDTDNNTIIGAITATKVDAQSLTTWDEFAGRHINSKEKIYHNYKEGETGKTICIMSASVNPAYQQQGIARDLLRSIIEAAKNMDEVTEVIAPIRPIGYGAEVLTALLAGKPVPYFAEYCKRTVRIEKINEDSEELENVEVPFDRWIRSAVAAGFEIDDVIEDSMVVEMSLKELINYLETEKLRIGEDKFNTSVFTTPYGIEANQTGRFHIIRKAYPGEPFEQARQRQSKVEGETFDSNEIKPLDFNKLRGLNGEDYFFYYLEQNLRARQSV